MNTLVALPLEFWLTGEHFEPWSVTDSVAIEEMLSMFMSLDFFFEPFKDLVRNKYGEDFAHQVFAAR